MNPILSCMFFWYVMWKSTEPDVDDADDAS